MRLRLRLIAGLVLAALSLGFVPMADRAGFPAALAQNLGQRVVNGTVLDDTSTAVMGATVFMRDTKTKSIRSYTSTKDGHFRFAQITMSDDYELWAEKAGKKSAIKTISSWDTRKEVVTEIRLK